MGGLRGSVDKLLAVGGAIIVVLQVSCIAVDPSAMDISTARWQVTIVLLALLMNQLGVWRLGNRLLTDRRLFSQLRSEVDDFIGKVRELHSYRLAGDNESAEAIKAALHESVDRIHELAAIRDKEP